MHMKNRWIGGLALATALTLGACAPTQQGAEESQVPAADPSENAGAPGGASPAASSAPDDYDY